MVKNIWEFDIFDFFSYIAPGVTAISLLYPITPKRILSQVMAIDGTVLLLALVLGGYIGGHFAHRLSDWLQRGFSLFSYENKFDAIADSDEKDPVQTEFFEKAPDYLGITLPDVGEPEREARLTALYHTSKTYLLTHQNLGSGRVEKFQTIYDMFHSLISIFSLYGIIYLVWPVVPTITSVLVDFPTVSTEYRLHRSSIGYVVVGVGLLWIARTAYHIAATFRKNRALVLITEFYTDVLLKPQE